MVEFKSPYDSDVHCCQMSAAKWYIEPEDRDAELDVMNFFQSIKSFKNSKGLSMFPDNLNTVDNLEEQSTDFLKLKLRGWICPHVLSLLAVDLEKEEDVVKSGDTVELLVDIRQTLLNYIKLVTLNKFVSRREVLDMFELIHIYRVPFQNTQYGMDGIWNCVVSKILEFIGSGHFVFLPFFIEWFPHMVTPRHYPKCFIDEGTFKEAMDALCFARPTLRSLYDKHSCVFEIYVSKYD